MLFMSVSCTLVKTALVRKILLLLFDFKKETKKIGDLNVCVQTNV